MEKPTLIALATGWGPKHGGINSFNYDFLRGFGTAFGNRVRVLCVVPKADAEEKAEADRYLVSLIPFETPPSGERLEQSHAAEIIRLLQQQNIDFSNALWLGHDLFTGAAAAAAAEQTHCRSAAIHHMSYAAYEAYKSGSAEKAKFKTTEQRKIFQAANVRLAVGPLLRDALDDWFELGSTHMLIPGLPEIEPKEPPKQWTAVLFGRLNPETDRVKQAKLGVAAIAHAYQAARSDAGAPPALQQRPRIKLFGVAEEDESELRQFAEQQAGAVLDLHPLPYSENRQELFNELSRASMALMPSWHEGFGLVGWEAIGAGVPLILGKESGLLHLLQEALPGAGPGCVKAVDVRGSEEPPYFHADDLPDMARAVREIAAQPKSAKDSALMLRELLSSRYTAKRCAEDFAQAVGWGELLQETPATPIAAAAPLENAPVPEGLLSIPQPSWQVGCGYAESQLLRAEEACVDFHPAREEAVAKLLAWAEEPESEGFPIAVRLHTGSGGVGKTRLLLETCRRLNDGGNWRAGFLDSNAQSKDIKQAVVEWLKDGQRLFVAIDYAETRRDQLAALVETAQKYLPCRVRIALIARDGGDWWDRLPIDYPACEQIFAGRASSGPFPLASLHDDPAERQRAYQTALRAYAHRLGLTASRPTAQPDLTQQHFANPLYLQMAALLALHGEQADTANGLTDALLRHENRYWHRLALEQHIDEGERAACHLLAVATLCGELATDKAAWEACRQSSGLTLNKANFNKLFRVLCPLYPGRQGLQPLRPDLLGEALLARALASAQDGGAALLAYALGKSSNDARRRYALTVLARAAQHRPELQSHLADGLQQHFIACAKAIVSVGQESGEPLAETACTVFESLPPPIKQQAIGILLPALPDKTVRLAKLVLLVACAKLNVSETQYKSRSADVVRLKRWAESLSLVAYSLSEIGQDDEALSYAQRANEVAKSLFQKARRTYEDFYAGELLNLGVYLNNVGLVEKAIAPTEEAMKIYRKLALGRLNESDLSYAKSLNNMSIRLSELGRYSKAADYARQAVEIYGRLADSLPDRYLPNYALGLNNLGSNLANLGDNDEAVKCCQKAMEIFHSLANERPDRYEPQYALSLNNVSTLLGNCGEGYNYGAQALSISRRLAEARPDRYKSDYANALCTFGKPLLNFGYYTEALAHCREAANIYHYLSEDNPNRYEQQYAYTLSSVASCYAYLGELPNAIDWQTLALARHQRQAVKRASVFGESCLIGTTSLSYYHWLAGQALDWTEIEKEFQKRLPEIREHRRPLLTAYAESLAGCLAHSKAVSAALNQFASVHDTYQTLSPGEQRDMEGDNLLALAYLAQHAPTPEREQAAQSAMNAFAEQRQGRLPYFIAETLRRLDCSRFIPKQHSKT